jgi:electron transport complex protein RnfB
MMTFWIAVVAISLLGLIFGVILGYASRRFAVEDDPVVEKLMSRCRRANAASAVTLAAAPTQKRSATVKKLTAAPPAAKR